MKRFLQLLSFLIICVVSVQKAEAQYCVPVYYYTPVSGYGYYINRVKLNTIDYTSGQGATSYNDFTDQSTVLTPGTYSMTLYDGGWGDYYMVWIDFDQDEVFESTERMLSDETYIYSSYTTTITVPASASPGATRMRVMCVQYLFSDMDPCSDMFDYYYYGEAEDYTILIPSDDPVDIGVTAVTSLSTSCGLGDEPVTVTIFNFGTESLASGSFDVAYQVTDPVLGTLTPVTETYTGADIPSLGSASFTFSTLADLSNLGAYTVNAYTISADDAISSDDASDVNFSSIELITAFPYLEDFESGAGSWSQYGTSSSWELGSPAGPVISGAPPTTPSSVKSWATNLDGYYNYYENSYVEGPCFDFSSLILPYVEFDIWWDTYSFNDGAQLEYSLDAGTTWTLAGAIGAGDNWYTSTGYSLGYDAATGMYEEGWVGAGPGWVKAHLDLDDLAGEPQVKFRIHFQATYNPYYDGVAFDNFKVGEPFPNDLGVSDLNAPVSSTGLTTSELVTVTVENFGTNTQSGFNVYYNVNGGPTHSDVYPGTLLAGETGLFTFSVPEDFGAIGDYTVLSWTAFPGDEDITNDTLEYIVHHLTPVTGTAAYYIHLSTEDPFYSTDNVEKMDEVFGEGNWTEAFFDTMDPDTIFTTSTCFVYLEGGNYTSVEFKGFLDANIADIENWVSAGGNLFLNAAPNEGGNIDLGFGDITLWAYYYIYDAKAIDVSFPLFNGPHVPVGIEWFGSWYNFTQARVTGDFTSVIKDYWSPTNYALGYKEWGDGAVLFGTMTPAEYHTPSEEAGNLRKNIFEFLKYCTPVDIGITGLITPDVNGCGLGEEEPITVTIKNFGETPMSSFPVKYEVDGSGTVITEIATPIVSVTTGETYDYTFEAKADFSATGLHTLDVWTDIYVDEDHTNDLMHFEITNLEAPVQALIADTAVCDSITLDAGNPGMLYLWSTDETSQTITATEGGDIIVSVTHPSTGCVQADTVHVDLTYTPTADFDALITGLTVDFTNMSSTGALYTWYFGDGTYSNEWSPEHTFTPNAYTVVLVAENECGYSSFDTILYIGVTSVNDLSFETRTVLYPNPASNVLSVAMNYDQTYDVRFELINSLGQVVLTENVGDVKRDTHTMDITSVPAGSYQLRISAGDNNYTKPVVIIK